MEYKNKFHQAVRKHGDGNTGGHGEILRELSKCDGMTQKELAERMKIRPQSLTYALVNLENEGFITRMRGDRDRREQMVYLTESGKKRSETFHKISVQVTEELFSEFTDDEKETLAALLKKITSDPEENKEG